MASHMKYKLPPFKLTKRSAGTTTQVKIPRGQSHCTNEEPSNISDSKEEISFQEAESYDEGNSPVIPEPSLHEIKQKASVTAWCAIRATLRHVAVECNGMPIGQTCIICSAEANYRCVECAAWANYCPHCFSDAHSKVGIFHTGEVWEVMFVL